MPAIEGNKKTEVALRAALAAKSTGYKPRTHHLRADGAPEFVNRLILETSPYLLQHAHNPVNWYPWSDEAFERAAREKKPVLLSIGYSTCHWCHVMEVESFEDVEIAGFLNEHFVAIKVDREERPDIDDIYMKAVNILSGRGGWPMTVALTPERKPFFGGTYFPARDGDRGSRMGFLSILKKLSGDFRDDPQGVLQKAEEISRRVRKASSPSRPGNVPGPSAIRLAVEHIAKAFDPQWGGFGRAPKFPRPVILELLLRYWRRTEDPGVLRMVTTTLDHMARGCMYDVIGGGFHRYSTERTWLVPHFEKMLYDNAQLAVIYTLAWQATGEDRFAVIARETLDYVAREMTDGGGAFYSATDADSPDGKGHQEEGLFFTWTAEEITAVVGDESAASVIAWFGVKAGGNFEHRSILYRGRSEKTVATDLGIDVDTLRRHISRARPLLYKHRETRLAPLRDDKILTAWNGLMISAFARAGFALDESRYTQQAERAAHFVLDNLRDDDGRLMRSFNEGEARHKGYLEDYSFFIAGLLDLYETTGRAEWLTGALKLEELLDAHYLDTVGGGYFTTADDAESLLARDKTSYDGAEPSGNSVAALNLLRMEEFTDKETFRKKAEGIFAAFSGSLSQGSTSAPLLLSALDFYSDKPLEIVIVRPSSEADDKALIDVTRRTLLPNKVLIRTAQGPLLDELALRVPLVGGKSAREGKTTAYVCEKGRCRFPTSDPAIFAEQIGKIQPLLENQSLVPLSVPSAGAR